MKKISISGWGRNHKIISNILKPNSIKEIQSLKKKKIRLYLEDLDDHMVIVLYKKTVL